MLKIKIFLIVLLFLSKLNGQEKEDFQVIIGGVFDITYNDFSDFENLMGRTYDSYKQIRFNNGLHVGGLYENLYTSISIGFLLDKGITNNSDLGKINSSFYSISFGYDFFNFSKFLVLPNIGLGMYRYRILMRNSDNPVTLDEYILSPRIDIKGRKIYFAPGINYYHHFKLFGYEKFYVGLNLKYLMFLNDPTHYRVNSSRLEMDKKIGMGTVSGGISLGISDLF